MFGPKTIGPKLFLGLKKIQVKKDVGIKINFDPKKIWVRKLFVINKILNRKIFWPLKIFWALKKFLVKTIQFFFGTNKILVKKFGRNDPVTVRIF